MRDYHIDRAIALLRKTDALGAACMMLRERNICPVCRATVMWAGEDAVVETRSVTCRHCHWSEVVGEPAYRGNPAVTLRGIVERAQALAKPRGR